MSSPPPDAGTVAAVTVTVRPWPLFIDIATLSLPISVSDATYRINKNLRYFAGNYALITLSILLISLIVRPILLVLFLIIFVGWIYLYFSRNEPLELFGFDIDDKFVLGFLTLVTLVALLVAKIWMNIFVSIGFGIVIMCVHGSLRAPEDQEDSPYGALLSESPRGNYSIV
ncbi:PRA1 family protein D-like [Solanum stenotomum]|uniref:PRA1 family protein D-like n=1 Tax=Solanum stenotomum TaxID=172797 RepID=UPI0020D1BD72|nr:PRA1 family protein D-like [Solanum stenotomum]